MPGFKLGDRQANQTRPPEKVVYLYTWDVSNLIGQRADTGALVYLKSIDLPSYAFEVENLKTGHATYNIAKGISWSDVKLSFYDTSGLATKLDSMFSNIWTQSGGLGIASEYMAPSIITVYYHDYTPAYKWVLKNSWIKSMAFSQLTYESSGPNNVNVAVAYSWAEYWPL